MRYRLFIFLMIFALLSVPVASAQDGNGLSDEEQALLDRVVQAIDAKDNYTSYARDYHETASQVLTVVMGDVTESIASSGERTVTGTQIGQGDDRNVSATITAQVENVRSGETLSAYTMTAEARLVDGVLYVQAGYDTPGENAPELPEGWVVVDDVEAYPAFSPLKLGDYLDDSGGDITDDPEVLRDAASEVTSEMTDEGELITVVIQGDGIRTLFAGIPDTNAAFVAMMDYVDADDQIIYQVLVDDAGNMLGGNVDWHMQIDNLSGDIFGLNQLPEGSEVSFTVENTIEAAYSQINEELEPATAPE